MKRMRRSWRGTYWRCSLSSTAPRERDEPRARRALADEPQEDADRDPEPPVHEHVLLLEAARLAVALEREPARRPQVPRVERGPEPIGEPAAPLGRRGRWQAGRPATRRGR